MRPLPFVLPYALIFWLLMWWSFGMESRFMRGAVKSGGHRSSEDAGSMWVVVIGNQLASLLAFYAGFRFRQFAMPHPLAMFWIGVWVLIAGTLLRRHCFAVLGEYFTFDVRVREQQPVIQSGAYRWVRHPSYTGGVLMFAGVGLAIGNWLSFALMTATILAVYVYRVRVEERALVERIGEPYREYMRRTKRFIPGVV